MSLTQSRAKPDPRIEDVKQFWERTPLFVGEASAIPGTREFFEEHRAAVLDCLAGQLEDRLFPSQENQEHVLDLGCGPGFWSVELAKRGAKQVTAADLTQNALALTRQRAHTYQVEIETVQQNAEALTFPDESFTHVNCQGVIHHTPDTESCVRELARVLRPDGTAMISVYYRNVYLRAWPILRLWGKALSHLGAALKGRGRENIYAIDDVGEIIRCYDGKENPIGKAYTQSQFLKMLQPHFHVEETFLHLFPARSLPFRIPRLLHQLLDRYTGFMIYARCRKKEVLHSDARTAAPSLRAA